PAWEEIMLLAARCYEMTGLGYLGTDIVFDKHKGPQLLELNARPGLSIQVANGYGLIPRLRHIESISKRHVSPQQRVDYVIRHLSAIKPSDSVHENAGAPR